MKNTKNPKVEFAKQLIEELDGLYDDLSFDNIMEEKINKIWYQMNMKEITSEQARQQVLDLFSINNQRELLNSYLNSVALDVVPNLTMNNIMINETDLFLNYKFKENVKYKLIGYRPVGNDCNIPRSEIAEWKNNSWYPYGSGKEIRNFVIEQIIEIN